MDNNEFEKLQKTQIEIMDEVHRVCCKNKIRYYIIGGTALGARRHGGYIPWDVDIDIAMPRDDYERFAQVCEKDLHERYKYVCYKNTKNYANPHALVCINNTSLYTKYSKSNPKEVNYGIFLDVFPLDSVPEDKNSQKKQADKIKLLNLLRDFKRGRSYTTDKKKIILKKLISKSMFFIDFNLFNKMLDKISKKYEDFDSGYWCSMASHYKYEKQCMPVSVYGTPTLVKFEDRMYYAPEMLDDYLTRIYGDYMKLPPEKDRQANRDLFVKVVFDK